MPSTRRRLLWYAFTLAVVTYLDRVCISAAAPFMMRDLGLSLLQMSVVFSAFTLAYSLFEVPSGWMGDVYGPRRVLTRIVVWWSVFTMLTARAWSYRSLVAIRFLFGAGEAGAFPNVSRSFSRWFPARERGRANGVLFLGSRAGGAVAPTLALLIIHRWGWRTCFVAFGAIGLAWALAWYWWYRDDPSEHPRVSAEELAWIRQDTVEADEAHVTDVPWGALLRDPNLYAICAMYFGFGYGLYFYFTWLPTYLIQELGFSALQGGLLAGLPFVLAGGADVLGGWLTDALARRRGLRIARCWLGSACFFGSAALLVASMASGDRVARAVLLALALASADLALGACWSVCLDVGHRYAGVVTGFMNTLGNFGGFLGPLVVGYVVQRTGSWTVPFYIAAGIYAASALMWLLIDPTREIGSRESGLRSRDSGFGRR